MFTNLTNGKRNQAAQIAMSAMALSMLTSCHFGDVEDVRPKDYADEERQFSITLDATTPSGDVSRATRTNITDLFTDGLEVVWKEGDQIAMFGKVNEILDEKAVMLTAGGGSNPHLEQNWTAHNPVDENDYISWANFTGEAKLKVGNTKNDANGKPVLWDETNNSGNANQPFYFFSFAYPYKAFAELDATSAAVTLDFNGQTGKLKPSSDTDQSKTIATDYEYAWGYGQGIASGHVSFGSLKFVDAMGIKCNDSEAHLQHRYKDGGLVLDNKMSIIRFALVYQPDEKSDELVMFKDYIANAGCKITKITLRDNHNHLYPTASLNLENGEVNGVTTGNIEIDDYQGVSLENISKTDKTGSVDSWGSAFYLAIPVPAKDMLMDCTLEIHVDGNNDAVAGLYYANFEERTFNEGRYYMTAPIPCTKKEQASIDNQIRIYLYYKASLVYDVQDINGGIGANTDKAVLWEGNQELSGDTRINLTEENQAKLANIQVGDVLTFEVDVVGNTWCWVQFCDGNRTNAYQVSKPTSATGREVIEITVDESWKSALSTSKSFIVNAGSGSGVSLKKITLSSLDSGDGGTGETPLWSGRQQLVWDGTSPNVNFLSGAGKELKDNDAKPGDIVRFYFDFTSDGRWIKIVPPTWGTSFFEGNIPSDVNYYDLELTQSILDVVENPANTNCTFILQGDPNKNIYCTQISLIK